MEEKELNAAEVNATETTSKEEKPSKENPKVLYKYVVTVSDMGLGVPVYDAEGLPLTDGDSTPSIDKPHIARDIIAFGKSLEEDLDASRLEQRLKQTLAKEIYGAIMEQLTSVFKSMPGVNTEEEKLN